jgi:signal transduction histidine kinase
VPERLQDIACSVLRESLRNALKHADPRRIAVEVSRNGAFELSIVNDGVPSDARGRAGMGLRIAAVEALQFGGVVEFGPAGDGEWRVRLIVPLQDAAAP